MFCNYKYKKMPQRHATYKPKEKGFTLIELSIVLVIIGLIVGAIFVGLELIESAGIRGTISQIGKYNAAVNTFRVKYNALPGDMLYTQAANFGFFQLAPAGTIQGMGDGNGLIEDGHRQGGGTNTNNYAGEISTFWRHLSDANLVNGQFGLTGNSLLTPADGWPIGFVTTTIYQSIPPAKLGRGISVIVMSGAGANYYALLAVNILATDGIQATAALGLLPTEAQNIDVKIDDGMPETGIVLALGLSAPSTPAAGSPASLIGGEAPSAAATSTSGDCVIGTGAASTDTYNVALTTGGNSQSCGLAFRFQ